VLTDLGARAPEINQVVERLGPFSQAAIPAVNSLGDASKVGTPAVTDARPVIADLRTLANNVRPVGRTLREVLQSFSDTGGIERLMDYLFYQVAAINGFDADGHYLRAGLILNACSQYAITPLPDCLSKFSSTSGDASSRAANVPGYADTRRSDSLRELDAYFHGKKLDLGKQDTAATSTSTSATSAQQPAAQPQQQQAAPQQQQAAPAQQPTATGPSDPEQSLLDYLLGGDG
jgi:hypothetical protein